MAPQGNTGAGAEAELPEYAGHYRLESCLGSGGMGVVHLARSASGMRLAVKVVHAEFAKDPEFRGRFRQEVAAARRVSGAFTAPVVDADPEGERPWMATQYIPGPTLSEHVKRNGPMAPAQLRRLMAGLAEALRDIHRVGVVHRDLKPSNVLLADDGPRVIDFGISRPKDSELRTETGKLIGTPPFMAPEQFRRPREVGPAADVFALGSVLVHAATGRGPFDSDSPYVVAYQVVHDEPDLTGVPENLAPLVVRCLAKEPADRPTPDELMRELRSVAASYDTQTFIPAQRTGDTPGPEPREPQKPRESQEPRTSQKPRASQKLRASREPRESREPRTGRRGGRKAALAGLALVLVATGALGAARLLGGGGNRDGSSRGGTSPTAAAGLRAWVSGPVAAHGGMPHCSYGAGELICGQAGVVFALDPADGGLLWRHLDGTSSRSRPPELSGGLVQPLPDDSRRLVALDPASGRTRWRGTESGYSGLQRAGNMLLLTGADGTVTGVDGASGRTRWSHRVPGQSMPQFAAFPGSPLAYAANTSDDSHTTVTAVDPATGDVRWTARLKGSLKPVGASGGSVYFLAGDASGATRAVVRYTPGSKAVRRMPLPVPRFGVRAATRGDIVYLLATGGALEALDLGAHRQLWHLETSVSRGSAPAADGSHVFVTAADGRLLAVDARTGTLVGQTGPRLGSDSGVVMGSLPQPVLARGHVYATAPDGTVFCVDAHDPAAW
ncbi:serine/threonine-protein kinase [Streptomyces sediminimaris]|uniref:serine/threonine-protein kinase n=1 Tax=Streptomyces sediminimaris TaxID=3383721 RepID=UPI00399AE3D4